MRPHRAYCSPRMGAKQFYRLVCDRIYSETNLVDLKIYYLKNQALQGRLVDALAHRGDERRDTLR